jgi:SAM-dependent methyltransferase
MIRKFLKFMAPRVFVYGQNKCNQLGKDLVLKRPVERILDLGCGNGQFTMEFADILKPKEIHGVEFVASSIEECTKKGIQCRKFDLNGKWSYESDYFDFILSSQNIEHMHNTRLYLEECYRCLKPGGQVIILTENLASWINIFALLFGWQPFSLTFINGWNIGNPFIWHADEPKDQVFLEEYYRTGVSGTVGHVRVLSYICLKDMLAKTGFKNIKLYSRGYLPLAGRIADLFCLIDRRHGHFLIASAQKI